MKKYDTQRASAAQEKYCSDHGLPRFAPKSGTCPRCGRNIYDPHEYGGQIASGIDVESAGSRQITGCPHCHTTFCD